MGLSSWLFEKLSKPFRVRYEEHHYTYNGTMEDMPDEVKEHMDQAFGSMDKAFGHMNKAFDSMKKHSKRRR